MKAIFVCCAIIFTSLLSNSALATDALCEGCSYSTMEQAALNLGIGNHRIASISTGEINGFSVSCPSSGSTNGSGNTNGVVAPTERQLKSSLPERGTVNSTCNRPLRVGWRDITPAAQAAIQAAYEFSLANNGDMARIDVDLSSSSGAYADSVLGILNDYQSRQAMFDYIISQQGVIEKYANMALVNLQAHLSILPNTIVVKVIFKDNSTINLNWDAALQILTIIPSTARDANGLGLVESNTANYAGVYRVSGINLQSYINYLSSLGVPVNTNSGMGGSSMTCIWNALNLSLTCTFPK